MSSTRHNGRTDLPVIWLLDVDGVLNAVAAEPDLSVWPADAWVRAEAEAGGRRYPILSARPVLDFVTEVAASPGVDVRWHTTWQRDAVANLAPALGLPILPVEDAPEWAAAGGGAGGFAGTTNGSDWWKLPAARRVVASGRVLVWTDDDLAVAGIQHALAAEPFPPDTTLLLAPRTHLGLGPAHLSTIAAFLQRWR